MSKQDKKLRTASFFTGAGGLDLGLEGGFSYLGKRYAKTSIETVFACDILKPAKVAFDSFWTDRSNLKLENVSIVDVVKNHKTHPLPKNIDIVTGGFPCQDFSISGKRGGFVSHKNHKGERIYGSPEETEGRGMLYYWMAKAISLMKPKIFIAENVKGILSIEGAVERITQDFESLGYIVQVKLLVAADFGVPQSRERVIFIGVRKDQVKNKKVLQDLRQGKISLHPTPKVAEEDYTTCLEALKGLKEPSESSDPAQQVFSQARFLPSGQGQDEIDLLGQSPTIRAEHHGNIEFRRLSKKHGGKHTRELLLNLPERRLTPRECARLQTFPDNYSFLQKGLSASNAYKIIGNAVPPLLGHALGTHLEKIWNKIF